MASSACCVASSARSMSRRILCATAWSRSPAATARLAKASSSPCCARYEIVSCLFRSGRPMLGQPLTRMGVSSRADSIFRGGAAA